MAQIIDGICLKNMLDYAVRNLNKHVKIVNQLNVFPVPDGDTGTNMVTTIHKGLMAVDKSTKDLSSVSKEFADSIVFEARGNSGVIVSQFLKGFAEKFYNVDFADGALIIKALEKGVQYAYSAVATPVEGTMLTVIKDATAAVKREFNKQQSVNEIIDSFIEHAKKSLENTPELLSVLKEKGVVDSGGAGIVYLFEGMKKYLDGESLEDIDVKDETNGIDFGAFNRNSSFEYGYCTELLIQLLNNKEDFDYDLFKEGLFLLGDSLVISLQEDKVRVHIHTIYPEKVFEFCHKYGEFLTLKVENMTVQHSDLTKRIMCSPNKNEGNFAVVSVAFDTAIQEMFINMGADIVVLCEENISTKDYIDAFEKCGAQNIIVFPNSSDAILAATQAQKLYTAADVTVINSRGIAECYASLPTIDFESSNVEKVSNDIMNVINNLYIVSVAKRNNNINYAGQAIGCNEYYSYSGKELVAINKCLEETVIQTVDKTLKKFDKEIITIFHKTSIQTEIIDSITERIKDLNGCVEVFNVATDSLPCELTISFE